MCTNSRRLNKRIHVALWASAYASPRCRNWLFVFAKRCKELNLNFDVNISCPISKIFVNSLHIAILQEYKVNWFTSINSKSGPSAGAIISCERTVSSSLYMRWSSIAR